MALHRGMQSSRCSRKLLGTARHHNCGAPPGTRPLSGPPAPLFRAKRRGRQRHGQGQRWPAVGFCRPKSNSLVIALRQKPKMLFARAAGALRHLRPKPHSSGTFAHPTCAHCCVLQQQPRYFSTDGEEVSGMQKAKQVSKGNRSIQCDVGYRCAYRPFACSSS